MTSTPKRLAQARVKANLAASASDLAWLKDKDPLSALGHPNCPPVLWWELAALHPIEALSSPAGALFLLEQPERWAALEVEKRDTWISTTLDGLPWQTQHLVAADCAERVLPLFESESPEDKRPHEAIRVRRLFACGLATQEQWAAARDAARDASWAASWDAAWAAARAAVWDAAWAAARAAAMDAAMDAARDAVWDAARDAARAAAGAAVWDAAMAAAWDAVWDAAWDAERHWQWLRLVRYARGEVDQ